MHLVQYVSFSHETSETRRLGCYRSVKTQQAFETCDNYGSNSKWSLLNQQTKTQEKVKALKKNQNSLTSRIRERMRQKNDQKR